MATTATAATVVSAEAEAERTARATSREREVSEVWNWDSSKDSIFILGGIGAVEGGTEQMMFYSDEGQSFVGYGSLEGTQIVVVVPEPATWALAGAGMVLVAVWRRRARR